MALGFLNSDGVVTQRAIPLPPIGESSVPLTGGRWISVWSDPWQSVLTQCNGGYGVAGSVFHKVDGISPDPSPNGAGSYQAFRLLATEDGTGHCRATMDAALLAVDGYYTKPPELVAWLAGTGTAAAANAAVDKARCALWGSAVGSANWQALAAMNIAWWATNPNSGILNWGAGTAASIWNQVMCLSNTENVPASPLYAPAVNAFLARFDPAFLALP